VSSTIPPPGPPSPAPPPPGARSPEAQAIRALAEKIDLLARPTLNVGAIIGYVVGGLAIVSAIVSLTVWGVRAEGQGEKAGQEVSRIRAQLEAVEADFEGRIRELEQRSDGEVRDRLARIEAEQSAQRAWLERIEGMPDDRDRRRSR
jgi:hypothetical protein